MYVGIDYSLSSPAICISSTEECKIDDCKFYFLTTKKKYEGTWSNIYGDLHKEWTTPSERYHNISQWVLDIIKYIPAHGILNQVTLEDYAMGAKGRVFHIGENAGVLKYRLWKQNIHTRVISPSEVKKYATGKGNANKDKMYEAFLSEHKYDIKQIMGQDATLDNPVTDIVDAYYICKAGIHAVSR
jgi:Holliday junction resolvasome RuvABC endonuclease subunit